nr:hypothetical protein HK105_004201 [Polyrhizophydium stewartii]
MSETQQHGGTGALPYMFGNVDERGQLEQDAFDEDLREALNSREAAEYLDRIITNTIELSDAPFISSDFSASRIQPTADAIDYSNIDELAEDLTVPEPSFQQSVPMMQQQMMGMPQSFSAFPTPFAASFPTAFPSAPFPVQGAAATFQPALSQPTFSAPLTFQQAPAPARGAQGDDDDYDEGDAGGVDDAAAPAPAPTGFMPFQPLGAIGIQNQQPHQPMPFSIPAMQPMTIIPPFMPMMPFNPQAIGIAPPAPPKVFDKERLAELFPGYDQGRLRFSELFAPKIVKRPVYLRMEVPKKLRKDPYYEVMRDDRDEFDRPIPPRFQIEPPKPAASSLSSKLEPSSDSDGPKEGDGDVPALGQPGAASTGKAGILDEHTLAPIMLDTWEEKVIWDDEQTDGDAMNVDVAPSKPRVLARFRNAHLDQDDWLDAIVFDEEAPAGRVPFHLDDPSLVISQQKLAEIAKSADPKMAQVTSFYKTRPDGKLIDRFNISEDWLYEFTKPRTTQVRQTYGPVSIQHSLPVIKMHPHYLKPLLHLRELRSFHRPAIKLPLNQDIHFSRLKAIKKRPKEVDPSELMRTPKDISLKDTSKFVLMEYSEEYPLIMQAIGMASLIYNYYRKKDDKDNFTPKMQNGVAQILESVDASPFFGYGDVKPGQTIQVLYNNLFRAPIFPQNAPQTDFLLIRHTYQQKTRYFLREIPNMYVVGQNFPVQEVPRPQARKITQSLKLRLQVVSYRLMWKDPFKRLRYDKLKKFFPMFSDAQIRQKLKASQQLLLASAPAAESEFAQYLKKGENTGWWKLKSNIQMPDEDGIRKIITPEQVCLYQSTLVGQQRLRDAGYGNDDLRDVQNEEEESTLDIEVQLAPWVTTKNFVVAATGKGMIKLFGPGDPTGCGEGFSFIRASMKEMFFKSGVSENLRNAFIDAKARQTYHKYSIVEQQKEYKEEIERIWTKQLRSLGSTRPPEDDPSDMERMRQSKRYSDAEPDDNGSMHGSMAANKNKVLVISRLVRNERGELNWKSEVIRDGRVINAYLRHRNLIENQDVDEDYYASLSEEERLKFRQRRTRDHVSRLQAKLGKKPTYAAEPEEGQTADGAGLLDENGDRIAGDPHGAEQPGAPGDPAMADAAALANPALAAVAGAQGPGTPGQGKASGSAGGSSRKRRAADASADATPSQPKVPRRGSPKIELSNRLAPLIAEIVAMPGIGPLITLPAPHEVAGYAERVPTPKSFDQIQKDVKNYKYKSGEAFLADVQLVASNCAAIYGTNNDLYALAAAAVNRVHAFMAEVPAEQGGFKHEPDSHIPYPQAAAYGAAMLPGSQDPSSFSGAMQGGGM